MGRHVNKEQAHSVSNGAEIPDAAGAFYLSKIIYSSPLESSLHLLLCAPALPHTSLIKVASMSSTLTKTEYMEGRDWIFYLSLSLGLTHSRCSVLSGLGDPTAGSMYETIKHLVQVMGVLNPVLDLYHCQSSNSGVAKQRASSC